MAVFKLSFLSPKTATPTHELRFDRDAAEIARALDLQNGVFLDHACYRLDQDDLTLLASAVGLALPETGEEAELRRPHALDTVPYLVHTGYELPLMLEGRKPFAFFSDDAASPWLAETKELFAPHVADGTLLADMFEFSRMCPTTTGGEKEQRGSLPHLCVAGGRVAFRALQATLPPALLQLAPMDGRRRVRGGAAAWL
ncbi:hypothetical protein [Ensifer sp. SL37]|uniref:hypothetical protein n=1 Tax=Ensifer sp. SL37 TaxID=2995137 RepID=UPI002272C384|nr:hypothetical protein [Ensifer sp. SL37]MCY1741641.1 hypothetical protein [Ensifer sp. SL37]